MARDGEHFAARPDPTFEPGNPPEPAPMSGLEQAEFDLSVSRQSFEAWAIDRHPGNRMANAKVCEHVAAIQLCIEQLEVLLFYWRKRGLSSDEIQQAKARTIELLKAQLAVWEASS